MHAISELLIHPNFPEEFLCTSDQDFIFDSSKATGADGIFTRMLKATASSITKTLSVLFNKSIITGILCYPLTCIFARVVPIPNSCCSRLGQLQININSHSDKQTIRKTISYYYILTLCHPCSMDLLLVDRLIQLYSPSPTTVKVPLTLVMRSASYLTCVKPLMRSLTCHICKSLCRKTDWQLLDRSQAVVLGGLHLALYMSYLVSPKVLYLALYSS